MDAMHRASSLCADQPAAPGTRSPYVYDARRTQRGLPQLGSGASTRGVVATAPILIKATAAVLPRTHQNDAGPASHASPSSVLRRYQISKLSRSLRRSGERMAQTLRSSSVTPRSSGNNSGASLMHTSSENSTTSGQIGTDYFCRAKSRFSIPEFRTCKPLPTPSHPSTTYRRALSRETTNPA